MDRSVVGTVIGLLAAGLLAGCGHAATGSSPGGHNLADACSIRSSADPTTAETCMAIVGRLNAALTAALSGKLPTGAEVTNNLFASDDHRPIGGADLTFVPHRVEAAGTTYEASLLVKASTGVATGNVAVSRYTAAPSVAPCPDAERIADMKSKGMTVARCDRTVGADGTVLIVNSQTEAFSMPPDPAFGRDFFVQCYRPDGVTVSVSLRTEPMARQSLSPGELPTLMTLDQVLAVAADPAITL